MQNIAAIADYIEKIKAQLESGHAKEHAYRPALQALMSSFEGVTAINDPKRSEHGNPDFVFLDKNNRNIIRGYAEAKDIVIDLDKTEKSEQMHRYAGYGNLFLTNYREFRFFRNGEKYKEIILADLNAGELTPHLETYSQLADELFAFISLPPERIRSGNRLAVIMGAKARRIRDNVSAYLKNASEEKNQELEKIYQMMKTLLVHDLSVEKFADMYAQTLVYGLFAARYNDPDPQTFSREEARELVPSSNPFLREFFDHIAGPRFDHRLAYIVDELCDVFRVSDLKDIITKHLKSDSAKSGGKDPIIHFYEDFLKEYDPAERKRMGAYYTPIPVVRFILNQVDRVLKEDFDLQRGLADTSKRPFNTLQQGKKIKVDLHRVQILDPAVGTATFLNETVLFLREQFAGKEGSWPGYVESELLPRLHGFELMMAPYTIAHLKLGLTLQESGAKDLKKRLGVYLTNTLEEGVERELSLFSFGLAEAVTEESRKASDIKHDKPIMVVIGNPPYSGVSSNETKYANQLIDKYKVEPGGLIKLQERKHWLNDDYVKFIAFAEDLVEKNGEGVVAMITNHGYLDNPTFRGMRWHLANTFDSIYVLDLHGNSKKKEVSPDGNKDENVFDIQQGVAIVIAVKTGKKRKGSLAKVYHSELWGSRKKKFTDLTSSCEWKQLNLDKRMLFFTPKNNVGETEYRKGIALNELFIKYTTGVITARDSVVIDIDKSVLAHRIHQFTDPNLSDENLRNLLFPSKSEGGKYLRGDSRGWKLSEARKKIIGEDIEKKIIPIDYRPFDSRYIYYSPEMVDWGRFDLMQHIVQHQNLALLVCRQTLPGQWSHIGVTQFVADDSRVSNRSRERGYVLPLYLYHENGTRSSNFNENLLRELTSNLSASYTAENIFDYCYGTLHSHTYREKFGELLRADFPRVPIPKNDSEFAEYVKAGKVLRELHLMSSPLLNEPEATYPESGSNEINKLVHEGDKVWINETQYFGNISDDLWDFSIGGYQPLQKWLKDRKGKVLSYEDIEHYQKIAQSIKETIRVMASLY